MPIKTFEDVEKYFDSKFEALSQDVEKTFLEKSKAETKEQLNELKKELKQTRDVTTAIQPKTKYANLEALYNLPGIDAAIPDMSSYTKSWTPETAKGLSGFAKAVYMREHGKSVSDAVVKALGETQGSTGGFFVPVEFKNELLKLVIEGQVVRPRATVMPMQTDLMRIPRIVDTTHASGVHGGVKGTFGAEAAALGTGDPAAGQVELKAKKFSDYITVSNELIQDSPIAIASLLSVLMKEGLGFTEDVSALFGTAASGMTGALSTTSNPALIAVTRTVTSNIVYTDVVNMYSRMFPSSLNNAVWIISPSCFPALAQMAVNVGTGGSGVWITNVAGNTADKAPPSFILGRPVIVSEKLAELGSAGDIAFCDFSYYLIGDRMGMTLTSSDQVAFATDSTAFRIIERLDGTPWINSALTPNKQTTTLSPFVSLAA